MPQASQMPFMSGCTALAQEGSTEQELRPKASSFLLFQAVCADSASWRIAGFIMGELASSTLEESYTSIVPAGWTSSSSSSP
jgi:hypothetical protein